MMGPVSTSFRNLVSNAKKEFNEFATALVNEAKQGAAEARDEERNRKLLEERLDSLRKSQENLQRRESQLKLETQLLSTEEEEVAARTSVLQAEANAAVKESTVLKEKKKNLIKDVAVLEMEKEKRVEEFKRRYESYSKSWKCHKNCLGIDIKLEGPDVFKVGFPKGEFLTLRSVDMESWEILNVEGDPHLKKELTYYLIQTGDIMGVICRARKAATTS